MAASNHLFGDNNLETQMVKMTDKKGESGNDDCIYIYYSTSRSFITIAYRSNRTVVVRGSLQVGLIL